MQEPFLSAVRKLGPFSEKDVTALMEKLQNLSLKKGAYLLKEGEITTGLYFVTSGSLRHYYLTEEHTEVMINLFLDEDWALDYASFTGQKPSKNYLQANEETTLLYLSLYNLHHLIEFSPSFFTLGRILETAVRPSIYSDPKVSPEAKYTHLLEHRPELLQKFQLKYIASYLGITPETLSRVRRKIFQ